MQDKKTAEYAAKVQKTVQLMETIYLSNRAQYDAGVQLEKAEKLLAKFGKRAS